MVARRPVCFRSVLAFEGWITVTCSLLEVDPLSLDVLETCESGSQANASKFGAQTVGSSFSAGVRCLPVLAGVTKGLY